MRTVGRYLKEYHNHLYAERDIERLNLALNLLDIIEEDGCCERVGKPFNYVKSKNKEDLYELEDDPESYYTIPVYVNAKIWTVLAMPPLTPANLRNNHLTSKDLKHIWSIMSANSSDSREESSPEYSI